MINGLLCSSQTCLMNMTPAAPVIILCMESSADVIQAAKTVRNSVCVHMLVCVSFGCCCCCCYVSLLICFIFSSITATFPNILFIISQLKVMCVYFPPFLLVVRATFQPRDGLGRRHELCEWRYWKPADASECLKDQSPEPSSPVCALGDH